MTQGKTKGSRQGFKWRLYEKRLDGVEAPLGDFRTQQEMAEYLGYKNGSYLNSIIKGSRPHSFNTRYRIVDLFKA